MAELKNRKKHLALLKQEVLEDNKKFKDLEILLPFKDAVLEASNQFRASPDFTAFFNNSHLDDRQIQHAKNSLLAFLEAIRLIAWRYYPSLPSSIRWADTNPDGSTAGIIVFQDFVFPFPFRWLELCPQELHNIPVRFNSCHFAKGFTLEHGKNMGNITFDTFRGRPNVITIIHTELANLNFIHLGDRVDFLLRNITTAQDINFKNCTITGEIHCENITAAAFSYTGNSSKLHGNCWLVNCQFEHVDMSNTGFEKSAEASKHKNPKHMRAAISPSKNSINIFQCDFQDTTFEHSTFKVPISFSKVQFHGAAIFNNCIFESTTIFNKVTFAIAPKFHEAKLHQDTDMSAAVFKDFTSDTAHRDYSTLKHHMEKMNAEIQMHRFHAYELKSRYNTRLPNLIEIWKKRKELDNPASQMVEKISSWVFGVVSDYHQSLLRPFLCLFFVSLYMAMVYSFIGGVECIAEGEKSNHWLQHICGDEIWRNSVYAVQQTVWPLGVLLQNDIWDIQSPAMKITSFFHLLATTIIWFLLILGIRKRFKL